VWKDAIGRRGFLRALTSAAAGLAGTSVARAAGSSHRLSRHLPVVVLDPGHGGVDPGAIGPAGTYEKNITLPVARELARQLNALGHYRVHLTRDQDEYIPLHDRVARARAAGAELFLSIHADALPDPAARGATVFTLSEKASDAEAAAIAASENKADLVAGIDLSRHPAVVSDILFDLARRETNNLSIQLARALVSELSRRVHLLNNSHRSAGFAVLKAPDVPSALVEIGCISNRIEEQRLQQPAYQRVLAAGLSRSIGDYFTLTVST
jgi:N-acetylmuramoyl-L-alanine amidase